MNETMISPTPEAPKKNNTWLIVGIVVVVLCCCCAVGGGLLYYAWQNGDAWLSSLGVLSYL